MIEQCVHEFSAVKSSCFESLKVKFDKIEFKNTSMLSKAPFSHLGMSKYFIYSLEQV